MNKKYYLPTVLFPSVICTTKQLIVYLITTIVFTKNVSFKHLKLHHVHVRYMRLIYNPTLIRKTLFICSALV